MKIIFVDGSLNPHESRLYDRVIQSASKKKGFCHWNTVSASDGYSKNKKDLEALKKEFGNDDDYFIITNSLVALMGDYGWNAWGAYWDVYVWDDALNTFYGVQALTDRELRFRDSIFELYTKGAFNCDDERYADENESESDSLNGVRIQGTECVLGETDGPSMPEVAPIRHGKWIPTCDVDGELAYENCSVCGIQFRAEEVLDWGLYCPHCGAIMDGR